MPQENIPPATNRYCDHCGGELDIRLKPGDGRQRSAETTCTVCGRKSGFSSTSYFTRESNRSIFQRLRNRRRRRRFGPPTFLLPDGTVDLRKFLEDVNFTVYGLEGRPHDLRLRGPGIGRRESKTEKFTTVNLTYNVGHPRSPNAALEFAESDEDPYRHAAEEYFEATRTHLEFDHVANVVRNNTSEEQNKRWFYEGEFNRLWNIDKASNAERESTEVNIAGETRSIEVASWSEPFNVSVYTFNLPPLYMAACSLNLSRNEVFDALESLADLQGNHELLEVHQTDLEQTRKLLWPDR